MKRPELLLPAGSKESLYAAAANGADAVYLGGRSYGARASAVNFDGDELKNAVKLCRKFGMRIYITVNTILSDEELPACLDYCKFLYDIGVDALIVQDIGLAGALRRLLPSLPLNASTQMTIHNVDGAKYAFKNGFTRVILSRECTLEEIREIHEALPELELEVFCHGALCVCYSGRCLMSSLIGERSGNRGMCAQPCRLAYDLLNGFGNNITKEPTHLLSPRELNTAITPGLLKDLIDAGVVSFKVEGRMRRSEYVATVGRVYRSALDAAINGESFDVNEAKPIEQVFNRKFTSGYFSGNPGLDLMSYDKPNNRGTRLGRVEKVKGNEITLALNAPLRIHDGIEIWVKVGGRLGFEVTSLKVAGKEVAEAPAGCLCEINAFGKIHAGDRVFKTFDVSLMSDARAGFENLDADIKVDYTVIAEIGSALKITAVDELGFKSTVTSDYIVQKAQKQPTEAALIIQQLGRLGGTGYALGNVDFRCSGDIMLPKSILNQCRRQIIEELENQLYQRYPVVGHKTFGNQQQDILNVSLVRAKHNIPEISVKVRDVYQAEAVLSGGADFVYFDESLGFKKLYGDEEERLQMLLNEYPHRLCYVLPDIHQDAEKAVFEDLIERRHQMGFREFLGSHIGDAQLKEKYPDIVIYGDYGCNIFNTLAVGEYTAAGFDGITASLECKKEQLRHLAKSGTTVEVIVHGFLPMMVSRHCVIGANCGKKQNQVPCGVSCKGQGYYLKDRKGEHFPVYGDLFHHFHIYNCRELCLIEELKSLTGFNRWRIEGQFYDIGTLRELVSLYRLGRDQAVSSGELQKDLLMEEVSKYSKLGFTKGHFHRGLY